MQSSGCDEGSLAFRLKKYRTKFPTARIKKIMQSDEDVGKVASAAPVLISKCLELLMQDLLSKTCTLLRERNAFTLTPAHLKTCIDQEERFDFLKDIVDVAPKHETGTGEDKPRRKRKSTGEDHSATTSQGEASSTSSAIRKTPTKRGRPRKDAANTNTQTPHGNSQGKSKRKSKNKGNQQNQHDEEDDDDDDDDEDDDNDDEDDEDEQDEDDDDGADF